jgi:ABC-type nitrate/sulfonate/bicarbonate transport system substrate-binding protein
MRAGARLLTLAALGLLTAAAVRPAIADPVTLRVGTPSGQAFSFIPLDAGIRQGFFAREGVEVERADFGGSGKPHQAVAAGAVDIAFSGGPDLAYVDKGAPEIGIAEMAGPPLFLGIVVPYDSPIKAAADLKGKKINVSAGGGVMRWLIQKLVQQQGWVPTTSSWCRVVATGPRISPRSSRTRWTPPSPPRRSASSWKRPSRAGC